MTTILWRTFATVVALAALVSVSTSPAQATFPERPVKIIVPFPVGGMADLLPRMLVEPLAAELGQPVVVENRPGATGNLGSEAAANSRPDGHTLLASPPPPLAINESLFPKLAFDPAAFVPVTVIAKVANVLAVPAALPVHGVDDLIAYARRRPAGLSYASTGSGGTPHLAGELFKSLGGAPMVHVPYKGVAQAIPDLVSGRVDLMFMNLSDALPHLRRGSLKVIGVGSEERDPTLPDVPTIAESIPGFVSTTWYALVAPPGTPADVAETLARAVARVLRNPAVAARLRQASLQPVASSPADAKRFIREEASRWGGVISANGIRLD